MVTLYFSNNLSLVIWLKELHFVDLIDSFSWYVNQIRATLDLLLKVKKYFGTAFRYMHSEFFGFKKLDADLESYRLIHTFVLWNNLLIYRKLWKKNRCAKGFFINWFSINFYNRGIHLIHRWIFHYPNPWHDVQSTDSQVELDKQLQCELRITRR